MKSKFLAPYRSQLGKRASGFDAMFSRLEAHQNLNSLVIVETGCVRKDSWDGDGASTILFNRFSQAHDCKFISLELNPAHVAYARSVCPGVEIETGDSVVNLLRLSQLNKVPFINLLYLDSYDIDWNNPHPSACHHLQELCSAMPLLFDGSLVFVDDNNQTNGKGIYVRDYMKGIGARLVHDEYQIGFEL
mgnify:CR=1 FL=1